MAFEVGQIVEGKVTGIMNYGAFVDLGSGASGMVHISEVAPTYVNEIKDHLTIGQEVKVKIIAIDERGKIALSIKQAMPRPQNNYNNNRRGNGGNSGNGNSNYNNRRGSTGRSSSGSPDNYDWNRSRQNSSDNFDDMLSKFMASSDEKISGMKKDNRRSRRGGNNGQNGGNQW